MRTFSVRTKSGVRVVPKADSIFEFKLGTGELVTVRGSDICKRPEERVWRREAR
jgi:RNase P/RNase MRP subunit p29